MNGFLIICLNSRWEEKDSSFMPSLVFLWGVGAGGKKVLSTSFSSLTSANV